MKCVPLFIFLFHSLIVLGQPGRKTTSISTDSALRSGVLTNGLTYYIKGIKSTDKLVRIRLVVKVGSSYDPKGQEDMAHLLEHMAFEGTKHYPGDSMLNVTAKHGMRFGSQITAATGDIKTVYILDIPANDTSLLNLSLSIVKDWTHDFNFEKHRVESQKKAVVNEYRMKNENAISKLEQEKIARIFNVDGGWDRLDKVLESMRTISYDNVVNFYKKWYRPDLQAVIVVGDIDTKQIEKIIQAQFGNIPAKTQPLPIPDIKKYNSEKLSEQSRVIPLSNNSLSNITIDIYAKKKTLSSATSLGQCKNQILNDLYNQLMSEAVRILPMKYSSPFQSVSHSIENNVAKTGIDALITQLTLQSAEDIKPAITDLFSRFEFIKKYGFPKDRVDAVKEDLLNHHLNRHINHANQYVAKFIEHFLHGTFSTVEYDNKLYASVLAGITADDLNRYASNLLNFDKDVDFAFKMPTSTHLPSIQTIEGYLRHAHLQAMPFQYKIDTSEITSRLTMLDSNIRQGNIVKEKRNNGVVNWQLSNGVEVNFYQYAGEEVVDITGVSQYANERHLPGYSKSSTSLAPSLVAYSGFGEWDKFQLYEYMKSRGISIHANEDEGGKYIIGKYISATSNISSSNIMFKLLHQFLTAPRRDSAVFLDWKKQSMNDYQNRQQATTSMMEVIDSLKYNRQSSSINFTTLNMHSLFDNFTESYAKSNKFVFYLSGNISENTAKQLVEKYLGSIPYDNPGSESITMRVPTWNAQPIDFKRFHGDFKTADVKLFIPLKGFMPYDLKTSVIINLLGKLLNRQILHCLRTQAGGAYSPSSDFTFILLPDGRAKVDLFSFFHSDPTRVDELTDYVVQVIKSIVTHGIDDIAFSAAKSLAKAEIYTVNRSGITSFKLRELVLNNTSPCMYLQRDQILEEITIKDLQNFIQNYFDLDSVQRFASYPEHYRQ